GRRARVRRRPAAVALPAVPQPPLPQAPGRDAGRVSVPAVSVLMSVHNGAPWVGDAVASVLAQTAGDLELIVIDDGSTDTTREILARARDPRVRVEHQTRAGLTRRLNPALALARAPLAARLDAYDLALPARLERQITLLVYIVAVGLVRP